MKQIISMTDINSSHTKILHVSPGAVPLCVLVTLVHMAISGGRVAVTLTALQLGRSTLEVGLLISVFGVLPMLLSVSAGRLIDAIGPYKPMQTCSILVGSGVLIPVIWQDLTALIISAICIGIGQMTFLIAVQGQVGRGSAEQRLRNFSLLSLMISISGFFGPLIAGIAIDYLGHRWVFLLLGIGPSIAASWVFRMRVRLIQAHIKLPANRAKKSGQILDLLQMKTLQKVFIANVLLSSAWDTHMFVVPIYGVTIGLSATTIGVVIASFATATVGVRLCLPLIQKYLAPWRLIHLAMAGAGLNFLFYPFCSTLWVLMTMSFLLGIALGSTQPGILALMQQHAPPDRVSEAFGLRMALINTSQVSLPLLFGALGTVIGVMPLFWITAAGLGAARWATKDCGKEIASADTI